MIKKFNEYIKEDILSDDEIYDQFLKLKELYDCRIVINKNYTT
jgi:hypothetical protein